MKKLMLCLVSVFMVAFCGLASAQVSDVAYVQQLAHPVTVPDCSAGSINYDDTCANFCSLFVADTRTRCASSTPSLKNWCENTAFSNIYNSMIATYHSLTSACHAQDPSDFQSCIDDWNCYNNGGADAEGHQCSGTGAKC